MKPPNTNGDAMTAALVVVPTYAEAENIGLLLHRIRVAAPDVDVLVVDDNSPDGTADLAEAAGRELGHIEVLRRLRKAGLGSAYRDGFAIGIAQGYDTLVEIDADLSHDPAALPTLIREVELGADLAIGSRYVPGGSIPSWSRFRRALSHYGNRYAAWILGVPCTDLTSGYRAFRADALLTADYATTQATGYAFQVELAHRVARNGGHLTEVPIEFNDRTLGHSKMSARITLEALVRVTWWGVADRMTRHHPPTELAPAAARVAV